MGDHIIAENRKARHDYMIFDTLVAGISLCGWEVKALRAGRVSFNQCYVTLRQGEAYLIGATMTPLDQTSTHTIADPVRTRKLLLQRRELDKLIGQTEQKGLTLVPLRLIWQGHRVKCVIALSQGKKKHDKRATLKERDEKRNLQRHSKYGL